MMQRVQNKIPTNYHYPPEDGALYGMINRPTPSQLDYTQDLSFEMFQDEWMAALLRSAQKAKEKAIREEDFVAAKKLKRLTDLMRTVSPVGPVECGARQFDEWCVTDRPARIWHSWNRPKDAL
jgi:hypothetical protein